MARGPRRLRNLNLEAQDAGQEQQEPDDLADDEIKENLQGPPDVDNILARMPNRRASPIKIIWPNGQTRQVLGDFGVPDLSKLQGGKVIVGTDENGVPNERSASVLGQHLGYLAQKPSFAPLHIPRWDNDLFNKHKEQIIVDVESKFVFPSQTLQLTRDWILRTVNNRWRAYKSKLKKEHFNREQRSLEQIIQGRPRTVNEHQWRSLVSFWCQETHKKLCATNSRCAKEQKNIHTTGRKSHARLKKEMEDRRKEKVHRIELWEAAHKKKSGRYNTNKVKLVMDASFEELEKRKEQNNGNLSANDFNEVFNEIVAKQLKARGYYDDKYWSQVQVSKGITFVTETEEERRYRDKVNTMDNKMQCMSGVMKLWLSFMSQKYPNDDLIKRMERALHDEVVHTEIDGHTDDEQDCSDDSIHGTYSDNDIDMNPKDPEDNVYSPENYVQEPQNQNYSQVNKNCVRSPLTCEPMVAKVAHIDNQGQADKGSKDLTFPRASTMTNIRSQRIHAPACNQSKSSQLEVYLISLRDHCKVVAKGKLVTSDSTQSIAGTVLGKGFVGVYVDAIGDGNSGDEMLPRPFHSIKTMSDAIGFVVAWPNTHVKQLKSSTQAGA